MAKRRTLRGARVAVVLLVAAAQITCSDDTGPARPVPGHIALAPRYVAEAAGIVPVSGGRFVLVRLPGGEVAKDTVISIPAGADSVDLALTVSILTPGERFLLRILLVGPANDTVFRAGPLEVEPVTSGAPVPVDVPLEYVGVGANAASVAIAPLPGPVVAGVPTTLTAEVQDSAGQVISGTPIAWRSLDTAIAQVPDLAVGQMVGAVRGTARIVAELLTGPADTVGVTITLPPAAIVADSGSGQTGPAAELLPAPLVARVTASDGVGVPDVLVSFAVTVGGGSLSADTVRTDSAGRARVDWTLGNVAGSQTVTATTAGVSGSAVFTATSQATGPGTVTITAGNNQSALVLTAVGTAPQVQVTDAQSNPVPNVEVVFAATQGGGTFTGGIDTTDAAGLAAVGSWTLGPAVGLNALTATVSGLTPVQFLALATSTGGVTSMTLNAGDGQTALAGTRVAIPPSVLLTDTAGAPVAGVEVQFLGSGGGSVGNSRPVSDANGIASVGYWDLGVAGTNTLTARMPGLPDVVFTATATVGAPAQIVIVSGNDQSDTAGTALPAPLIVKVVDSAGNAVPDVQVGWSTFDGSITPPSSTTDVNGQAQANWTLSTNTITQTATATVTDLIPAVFTATAIFPNPSILLGLAGGNRVQVGTTDTLEVTLTAPAGVGGVFVSVVSSNPAVLQVDPDNDGVQIPEGAAAGIVLVNGLAGGSATLTATAPNYADGQLTVPVSVQVLSMPGTLNVPFGATASLPVQISTPAPAGGEVVTLISDQPTLLEVVTPTVTIPEGAQTANATVAGLLPGGANVTGTSVNYGVAVTAATVAANLNVLRTSVTIDASFGDTLTVRLESNGSPIAAPAPGVAVSVTAQDPTCVAATSPVNIPTGLVDIRSAIAHGGNPQLPCTTWVVTSATNIAPDSVSVTVNPPPAITSGVVTVGAGLLVGSSLSLGTSNHGGVDVTVTSLDPTLALVSTAAAVTGTAAITIPLADGSSSVGYTVHGLEGVADTGDASVTFVVSAPGFRPDTVTNTVRVAGVRLAGLSTTTTSLSPDDPFVLQVGVMNAARTALQQFQNTRPGGGGLTGTIVLSDSTVAQLKTTADSGGTVSVTIPEVNYQSPGSVASGGAAFDPIEAGVTTATAAIPGLVPESNAITVTISAPTISLSAVLVGQGLQVGASGGLGASQHGGVDVIVKSLDPSVALIAPNQSTVGGDSLVIPLPNGSTSFSYTVQALEDVAPEGDVTVQVEVRAAGFVTDTITHTIRQVGVRLAGLSVATTTLSPDDPFVVQVGVMNAGLTALQQFQNTRPGGGGLTATIVLSDSAVAGLTTLAGTAGTATVQIAEANYQSSGTVASGGVAFDPIEAGVSTATATIPGVLTENNATTVTISAPTISVGNVLVGSGLQVGTSASLGASQHGGVDVVVKSLDPTLAIVSVNQSTVGGDSLVVPLPNGSTGVSYTVQGLEGVADTGDATVLFEVRASGFVTDTAVHTIRRAGVRLAGLSTATTTLTPDDPFVVQVGVMNAGLTALQQFQNIRPGNGPLTATVTNSVPGVGQLVTNTVTSDVVTVQIAESNYQSPGSVATGGVAFDPLTSGSTDVSATIPGLLPENNTTTVTVTTPSISISTLTVGAGLQINGNVSLGATGHGGVNVILKSSNPQVALVSPNSSTPGTDSIVVFLPNGSSSFGFYVQGVEFQAGGVLLTARASGFTDGSATSTVVTPGLRLGGLLTSISATAADDPFWVEIGIPNGNQTDLQQFQNVRAGAPGPLTATVQTETSGFGLLVTTTVPDGATSVTVEIPSLNYRSPTTVASGGVAFRPVAQGTIPVFATIPTFIALPGATRSVTVTP